MTSGEVERRRCAVSMCGNENSEVSGEGGRGGREEGSLPSAAGVRDGDGDAYDVREVRIRDQAHDERRLESKGRACELVG